MLTAAVQCPAAYASPEAAVHVRLMVKLLGDYLNEMAYPAELAGLSYSITNTLSGFQVRAVCEGLPAWGYPAADLAGPARCLDGV